NLRFLNCNDPNILVYAKISSDRGNVVIIVVNLDPHGAHEDTVELPLAEFGIPADAVYSLEEAFTGRAVACRGAYQRLHLEPPIIYQLHVKAFFDADNDGIGDFEGLRHKLDYLQDLGVTTLWLLPFYPSPLRDDGYDISDYKNINPSYGKMADFKAFIREAHRRNIRVITELIINHTSDQHPWFQ